MRGPQAEVAESCGDGRPGGPAAPVPAPGGECNPSSQERVSSAAALSQSGMLWAFFAPAGEDRTDRRGVNPGTWS